MILAKIFMTLGKWILVAALVVIAFLWCAYFGITFLVGICSFLNGETWMGLKGMFIGVLGLVPIAAIGEE